MSDARHNAALAGLLADSIAALADSPRLAVARADNALFGAKQLTFTYGTGVAAVRVLVVPVDVPVFIGEAREPVASHFNEPPQGSKT